jgi:hypothetical protein
MKSPGSWMFLAAAVVAMVVAASASAVESTINPGIGIGKVRLGMSQTQVKQALGKWTFVNERKADHLSVGWGFGEWTVDFISGKVVEVSTTLRSQRTASHIGPGSSWHALVRAYPHGVCAPNNQVNRGRMAEYLVPHKGGTQTIYYVPEPNDKSPVWLVGWAKVRKAWESLPEFAPTRQLHCRDDWRTSDAPEE